MIVRLDTPLYLELYNIFIAAYSQTICVFFSVCFNHNKSIIIHFFFFRNRWKNNSYKCHPNNQYLNRLWISYKKLFNFEHKPPDIANVFNLVNKFHSFFSIHYFLFTFNIILSCSWWFAKTNFKKKWCHVLFCLFIFCDL